VFFVLVKDLMSPSVITAKETDTVAEAAKLLSRHNIGAVPVISGEGVLRGILTDRDITIRAVAAGKRAEQCPVCDIMTTEIAVVSPDATADESARLMAENQVRRLPVVSDGSLCGMVTLCDLARNVQQMEAARALTEISMP
jgi:CBS domain-containing protein